MKVFLRDKTGVFFSLLLTLTFTPAMLAIKAPKDEEDD